MDIYKNLDINDLENEIWKDILDYEGNYQVSNIGRVKSFKQNKINGKIQKQYKRANYFCVKLYNFNKIVKNKFVHILVFETFNNDKLKTTECVHHIDEDKENNNINNLNKEPKIKHICDHYKNNLYFNFNGKHHLEITKEKISNIRKEKFKNGELNFKGENAPNNKIPKDDIINIKILIQLGFSNRYIAKNFNTSHQNINSIRNKKSWSHLKIIGVFYGYRFFFE
jgi:hypothetical protein